MQKREPVWRSHKHVQRSRVPLDWWRWLIDPDSLTARLQCACNGRFHVEVVRQQWATPLHNESRVMGLPEGRRALLREVFLYCDEQPWVFARTILPATTLTGRERRLMHLGNKPLGAVLFADPGMRRSEVELACIRPGQRLFNQATKRLQASPKGIWGRRSVFWLHQKPLLVSEIFLPDTPNHP